MLLCKDLFKGSIIENDNEDLVDAMMMMKKVGGESKSFFKWKSHREVVPQKLSMALVSRVT